jgi:hypothetical protein
MTSRQKLILGLFAVVDLIVIIGLAVVVVRSSQSNALARSRTEANAQCQEALLNAAREVDRRATTSQSSEVVLVRLPVNSVTGEPTPQDIWTVIDHLAPSISSACPDLSAVVLYVTVCSADAASKRYTVELDTDPLREWQAGRLSETDFAATVRWRAADLAEGD